MNGITAQQALLLLRARLTVETLERHMDDDINKTVQYRVGRVNMLAECIALVSRIEGALLPNQEKRPSDCVCGSPNKMPDVTSTEKELP